MRLSFEERENVKSIYNASKNRYPAAILDTYLKEGRFELTARLSALYKHHGFTGTSPHLIIALIGSGSFSDQQLCLHILSESKESDLYGELPGKKKLPNSSYIDAAIWLLRFASDAREEITDYAKALLSCAELIYGLKNTKKELNKNELSMLLRKASEAGLPSDHVSSFYVQYLIKHDRYELAFTVLNEELRIMPQSNALRYAANEMFRKNPFTKFENILVYGKNSVEAYGLGILKDQGVLYKEFTGLGYLRGNGLKNTDSGYAPIGVCTMEEFKEAFINNEIKREKTFSKRASLANFGLAEFIRAEIAEAA